MKKPNPHIGSSFEAFLREEGIVEEIEQLATKKLNALQLREHIADREAVEKRNGQTAGN